MCVVSMVGDHYGKKFEQYIHKDFSDLLQPVNRHEFNKLREDVNEMKELLRKANEYDKRRGEPSCQNEDKLDMLRKIATAVGVDLDEAFK